MNENSRSTLAAIVLAAAGSAAAQAGDFDITGPTTAPLTLGPGSGQTGLIEAGGSLTVGGSTVAITLSGANATLTNLGTITETADIKDNIVRFGLSYKFGGGGGSVVTRY